MTGNMVSVEMGAMEDKEMSLLCHPVHLGLIF